MLFVEQNKLIGASAPADMSGKAMTAKRVSMKNYGHLNVVIKTGAWAGGTACLLYTSPSQRDRTTHRMPASA